MRPNAFMRLLMVSIACATSAGTANTEEIRTWTDASGKFQKEAALLKIDGGTVHLKTADGKIARIPLTKLSDSDQRYVERMAADSSADPFETEAVAGADGTPRDIAAPFSGHATRTVIGQGVGPTSEDAKKDAFRDAVRQVVGTLVATAAMVENDALIEDKVLSLSGGFLNRVDMLPGFPKQDGTLWRVKIKAEVQVTEVLATLGKANVTTLAIRSDDLEAQRVTIADQQSAKLEALNDPRMWENFPGQFFKLAVTQQPKISKAGPETSELTYSVELTPNLDEYKAFADKLAAILSKTGGQHGEFSNDGLKPNCDKSQLPRVASLLWQDLIRTSSSDGFAGSLLNQRDRTDLLKRLEDTEPTSPEAKDYEFFCFDQGGYGFPKECGLDTVGYRSWQKVYDRQDAEFVLCMLAESNKSWSKTRWRWFTCQREEFPSGHQSPWLRGIDCEIAFRDQSGTLIATDSFSIGNGIGISRYGEVDNARDGGMIFVSPFWIPPATTGAVWDRKGYVARAAFHRSCELDSEEIKNIKTVSCRVKTLPITPDR
jgi:hypothetical protein